MREILFKAKKWDSKEWVEGSLITLDAGSGYYFISEPYTGASTLPVRDLIYNHTHLIDAKTICQFTGLLDKNGNKIWENDIVYIPYIRLEDSYCKVIFRRGQFIGEMADGCEDSILNSKAEVIGNIFDNKELLEE